MVERRRRLLCLSRLGLDPDGALYKMYNDLSTASGNEKKTRKWEGTDDLTALINSLDESHAAGHARHLCLGQSGFAADGQLLRRPWP